MDVYLQLKRLLRGIHRTLKSTVPPVTVPAWPAMFTGKKPERLGMFYFGYLDEKYQFRVYGSSFWRNDTIWKILEDHDIISGVSCVPANFPLYKLKKGFMLAIETDRVVFSPEDLDIKMDLINAANLGSLPFKCCEIYSSIDK